MNGTIKNMLVGIFILGAITLSVATIMFLKPSVGDDKQVLNVRFSDIGKINIGTRVLFAGKPVGEVVALEEIHNAREQPTDELGRVYFYQLTLRIDSKVKVYNTDEISIQTSGLMGEKSIAIVPKAPPKGVTPIRITEQPIYANSVDSFQNALIDFSDLAANMEETFKQINDWIKDHGESVARTIHTTGTAMEEIDQAISSINQTDLIFDVKKTMRELKGSLIQVQVAMQEMEDKQAFKNMGIVMQNLKSTTQCLTGITEEVMQGKGTLGRCLIGDDLYLQMNAMMTKANTLMNDFNHYGILFHLNKQWQRTRLQRMNLLDALKTPESFQHYFQTEVDDINASMNRISMLIQKAEHSSEKSQILQNTQFKQDFAELMRRADELSDNLRLYNQQLNEAVEK